jgi:hypothetical protein
MYKPVISVWNILVESRNIKHYVHSNNFFSLFLIRNPEGQIIISINGGLLIRK